MLIFKSQLKSNLKRSLNFVGIFVLLFLSVFLMSSSFATSGNVNKLIISLNYSNNFKLAFNGQLELSKNSLDELRNDFFSEKVKDRSRISDWDFENNKKLELIDQNADLIKYWDNNYRDYLLYKKFCQNLPQSKNNFGVEKFASKLDAKIADKHYQITAITGFNDSNWWYHDQNNEQKSKYNYNLSDFVCLTEGRKAIASDEIVVEDSLALKNNHDLNLGQTIEINQKKFRIVGRGYNYFSYLKKYDAPSICVWFTNSSFSSNIIAMFNEPSLHIRTAYFFNLKQNKIKQLSGTLTQTFQVYSNQYLINTNNYLKSNEIANVRSLVLSYFLLAILIFFIVFLLLIPIIKKEIYRQRPALGLLMAMGTPVKKLVLVLGIAFMVLNLIPIIMAYWLSYYMQIYLNGLIAKIIFLPFDYFKLQLLPFIITLVVFPIILTIIVSGVFWFFINFKSTQFQYEIDASFRKQNFLRKTKKPLILKKSRFYLTWIFFKANFLKIIIANFIFFLNVFLAFFFLTFASSYQTSIRYLDHPYTTYGNRMFLSFNPSLSSFLDDRLHANYFNANNNNGFHWIAANQFEKEQSTYYQKIDLNQPIKDDMDLTNKYISAQDFKAKPEVAKKFINYFYDNPNHGLEWQSLVDDLNKPPQYPTVTFGFKIYYPENSLLFSEFPVFPNHYKAESGNNCEVLAFQNQDLTKWIKIETDDNKYSLREFKKSNNEFINAIISAELAKQLALSINQTFQMKVSLNDYQPDLTKPLVNVRVVGINKYNYIQPLILVDQTNFFDYLTKQANNLLTSQHLTPKNYNCLFNSMIVRDQFPEMFRNISLFQWFLDTSHTKNESMQWWDFITHEKDYLATNFPPTYDVRFIKNTIAGFITLIYILLILCTVIINILFSIVYDENKKDMVTLKFMGYNSATIFKLLLMPYFFGFIFCLGLVYLSTFCFLKILLNFLFNQYGLLLLFKFSWMLAFSFMIGLIILSLLSLMVGKIKYTKTSINYLTSGL